MCPERTLFRETSAFLLICVIAAIALYAMGSRELFAWSWPLLVGVLILACAGSLLAKLNAGTVFYRRQLRIQFSLEFALFYWTRSQRHDPPDEMALQYLRKARRAAGRTSLGTRLDSVIDRVKSGDHATVAKVAGELQAILGDFSLNRASRLPFRNYWVLPSKCLVPISFIVAVIGVVAPAYPAINPPTVDGFLQALVLFGLTFEGLRLLRIITFKIHDVLSNQAFRVAIISTTADRTVASDLAEALYPKIGHVVHVLVNPEAKEPISELHESGKYWFITDSEGVSDVLTAVAQNSDLFVLDGGGELLAETVRTTTNLPESRYLALSPSDTVPQGFRWIEPLALRADLSSDPNADPYRLSVLPGKSIWEDWLFQLLVFASLVFFQVDGGRWLAILIMLGAVGRRFPDQIGVVRRSLISRTTLRAPSAPRISQRLVPRVLERRLWVAMILMALPGLFLIHPTFEFGADRASDFKLAVAAYIALFACAFSVSGSLFAVKWSIDRNFRILVLRRNARKYGYAHKALVMATCGKYGQVISIRDDTFDQTDDDYGEWRESSLGFWFQIFSEINTMIRPVGILDTWKRRVLMELEVADFAVFDWIDEITENMQWELRSAAERLPAHRMLIVCSPERQQMMVDAIASSGGSLNGKPHCLITLRGPDDEYIWANHEDFDKAFGTHLHDALSALVAEPRQCHRREAIGAWPYPVRVS